MEESTIPNQKPPKIEFVEVLCKNISFLRKNTYIATPIKIIKPMNKKRRTRLEKALAEAERLTNEVETMKTKAGKIAEDIETLAGDIELLEDEEQEAHDNLPDSIQWSDKGETMQDIVYALQDAKEYLADASTSIHEALNQQ